MFAVWAAIAAFGFRMTPLAVIVAVGTGVIFTRRVAPLGGAGIMLVALAPTLWYGAGVPSRALSWAWRRIVSSCSSVRFLRASLRFRSYAR
jgi:hypothetical protein